MLPLVHCAIGAMFKIPTRLLEGRVNLADIKADLTAIHVDSETGEKTPVIMYRKINGGYEIPRAYAKRKFPDLWASARDLTTPARTTNSERVKRLMKHSIVAREGQQEFMDAIKAVVASDNVSQTQIKAATGSGKTVSFVVSNADVGNVPVLVVVHTNSLKNQWLGDAKKKKGLRFIFGDEWVDKYVGIAQQGVCDYQGKLFVIGMAPSIARREYPPGFYKYFGVVGYDEIHKLAGPQLWNVLRMFTAQHLIAMSATPKKGPMAKVVNACIGSPSIKSNQTVMQPTITRIRFEAHRQWFHWKTGAPLDDKRLLITRLSQDKKRQELLTDMIELRGYNRGRQCLVLSDRTAQLTDLKERLVARGIPEEDIGIYAGSYMTDKFRASGYMQGGSRVDYAVLKKMIRSPVFDNVSQARKWAKEWFDRPDNKKLRDKNPGATLVFEPQQYRHSPKEGEYEDIERRCRIVLATYGIFADGIDIARLDWALEATPRGDVEQGVGRILRLKEGKLTPEWYSIFDNISCTIHRELPGKTVEIRYIFKRPIKLEQSRRTSYRNQNAVLRKMDNPYEALQTAKNRKETDRQGFNRNPPRPRFPRIVKSKATAQRRFAFADRD